MARDEACDDPRRAPRAGGDAVDLRDWRPRPGPGAHLSQDTRNGPITIEATNGIEWSRDDKTYIARGQAVARRGDLAVRADTLTARYRETAEDQPEIFKIEAIGGVVLVSPRERVEGARGVYDIDRAMVKLTGAGLRFTSGEHVITARDSLEYWRAKELAVARGTAKFVRAQQSLRADQLTAHFRDAEGGLSLALVEATGGVIIQTADEIARGKRGVYNAANGKGHSQRRCAHHARPKSVEWRTRRGGFQNRRQSHARRR